MRHVATKLQCCPGPSSVLLGDARRPKKKKEGVIRESNPRPPAPEAGIIPLDQSPFMYVSTAFVAQWIEHQTSNLGVAGSSPAEGTYF